MPTQYIYEPWTAPESVQKAAKCVIGKDYPMPMVDHSHASHINMERLRQVYKSLLVSSSGKLHHMKADFYLLTHFLPSKLCTRYSYVHSQSQNKRKTNVNFAKHAFKICGRKLPVTSLADFCQEIGKAVGNSKNESIH
jgi:hypothetical protein